MSVLVYTENWDGKFKKLSFELVSYATGVAKMLSTSVTAVSIGKVDERELKKLGNYGADKIISVSNDQIIALDSQAYTSVISEISQKENTTVIIISNNNTGKAIAPRLSVRFGRYVPRGVSILHQKRDVSMLLQHQAMWQAQPMKASYRETSFLFRLKQQYQHLSKLFFLSASEHP